MCIRIRGNESRDLITFDPQMRGQFETFRSLEPSNTCLQPFYSLIFTILAINFKSKNYRSSCKKWHVKIWIRIRQLSVYQRKNYPLLSLCKRNNFLCKQWKQRIKYTFVGTFWICVSLWMSLVWWFYSF